MIGLLALCIVNSLNYIYYILSIIFVQLDFKLFKRIKAMLHFDYCDAALPVCIIYCKSL